MKVIRISALLLVCIMLASACVTPVFASDSLSFEPETKNGKIYGFPVNSVSKTVKLVYYNAVVEVLDRDGKKLSADDYIGTGFTVKLNGISYAAVVMGDVDGDGELTPFDYLEVKRAYLGSTKLEALELEAAGVKSGGTLRPINYIMIKRAYFGTYDMNREYASESYTPGGDDSGWTPGWV